ncbi:MAG TPA: BtrH N-terminal domain-containing protein [Aggregatilineales bacterium]|nr:BtrH N-terminal domain-containing protein [Aggregatilineales bacterium]
MKPFDHFKHFETHHCETGSMRHIYVHNDHPLSEELLFGLGEGLGFIYWHQKGQPPFIGGRAMPNPSIEELAGLRTGVKVVPYTTSSARKAESTLLNYLEAKTPMMLQVDMGYLPYFDFDGNEYHFGGHVVVACGYDAESRQVLIADRDADLHIVSWDDLSKARNSKFKPFSPQNRWFTFDFTHKRLPTTDEIYTAIHHQIEVMLNPPISNMGVKGIRKTAKLMPEWKNSMSQDDLKWSLFNTYIFISADGGSGGGIFRYMFGRFLAESAELTGNKDLIDCAEQFRLVGDEWDAIGKWCLEMSKTPTGDLMGVREMLNRVADMEEQAWLHLRQSVVVAE